MAHTRDFLIGVFVGSLVGAAAALLYAPQSGPETRRFLKEKSDDARESAAHAAQEARERAEAVAHKAQESIDHLRQEARARVQELSQEAGELVTKGKETVAHGREVLDRQKSAVVSAVEAGRQAYASKAAELSAPAEAEPAA